MNGFDFEIDEEAPPTKRVKLISYPFSKGAQFGVRGPQFSTHSIFIYFFIYSFVSLHFPPSENGVARGLIA